MAEPYGKNVAANLPLREVLNTEGHHLPVIQPARSADLSTHNPPDTSSLQHRLQFLHHRRHAPLYAHHCADLHLPRERGEVTHGLDVVRKRPLAEDHLPRGERRPHGCRVHIDARAAHHELDVCVCGELGGGAVRARFRGEVEGGDGGTCGGCGGVAECDDLEAGETAG
jgi:hypothetical protein